MALNEFEGTVMLVSHDRALLRAVCDEFWLVSRGGIEPFDGDLDDYQRYLLEEAKRQREAAKKIPAPEKATHSVTDIALQTATKPGKRDPKAKSVPQEAKLKRELEQVELRMQALNHDYASLENKLASNPPLAEIAELGRRLKETGELVSALEEQWLELSSKLEPQPLKHGI